MREHPLTAAKLEHLSKLLGRGVSYSQSEREAILSGSTPEWILRGTRLKGELGERCRKAAEHLQDLFTKVWPRVRTPEDSDGH